MRASCIQPPTDCFDCYLLRKFYIRKHTACTGLTSGHADPPKWHGHVLVHTYLIVSRRGPPCPDETGPPRLDLIQTHPLLDTLHIHLLFPLAAWYLYSPEGSSVRPASALTRRCNPPANNSNSKESEEFFPTSRFSPVSRTRR